jgi:hypothetical protein
MANDFRVAFDFVSRMRKLTLRTRNGTAFTAEATESAGRRVIVFRHREQHYAPAFECCWGHYYNCNRTRIWIYCAALDSAVTRWFERKVAELKAELEKLPADRQEQFKREFEKEIEE